jgi:rhomboid protease GluP
VLVGVNDDACYSCGRRNPGLWGYGPALRALGRDMGFVPFVIASCVIVHLLALLLSGPNVQLQPARIFSFLGPSQLVAIQMGASGVVPVFFENRWWTVLSAAWVHAGLLHLGFNMMALRQLAPAIADIYGPGRMVLIYTAGSVVGFTSSSLAGRYLPGLPIIGGGAFTIGASASIAALIGALWYYGRRGGSTMASSYASTFVIYMIIIGFAGGIDNWAHAGGFAGGYLAARFLDPLKPERVDHIALALVCLALSLLSIVLSYASPLSEELTQILTELTG